jgi:HlyD family secretion protein
VRAGLANKNAGRDRRLSLVVNARHWRAITVVVSGNGVGQTALAQGSERATATRMCFKDRIRVSGFAVAQDETGASLALPGYFITDVLVRPGDTVEAGQELLRAVRADDPSRGAQQQRPPGGAPAQTAAGGNPNTTSLRAPAGGLVTHVDAKVGAASGASSNNPQFRISVGEGVDLLVDVPSVFARTLKKGVVVQVVRGDGVEVKGAVRVPVSQINPTTQLGVARIALGEGSPIRRGQFASAIVEAEQRCGVALPKSAIKTENGASSVRVVSGSKWEARAIRVGLTDGDNVEISDGLKLGESVVLTP